MTTPANSTEARLAQPITKESACWSSAVQAKLTPEMLELINLSSTLRTQLNRLGEDVLSGKAKKIELSVEKNGSSYYESQANRLVVHINAFDGKAAEVSDGARLVTTLSHELGHRGDDELLDHRNNTLYKQPGAGKAYTDISLRSEANSLYNNFIVRKEILANGGESIYFAGAGDPATGALAVMIKLDESLAGLSSQGRKKIMLEQITEAVGNNIAGGTVTLDRPEGLTYREYHMKNQCEGSGGANCATPEKPQAEVKKALSSIDPVNKSWLFTSPDGKLTMYTLNENGIPVSNKDLKDMQTVIAENLNIEMPKISFRI